MRRATFSTRGREISSPAGESISHLAEIEFPGGGEYFRQGRLHTGTILFRVTGSGGVPVKCRPSASQTQARSFGSNRKSDPETTKSWSCRTRSIRPAQFPQTITDRPRPKQCRPRPHRGGLGV